MNIGEQERHVRIDRVRELCGGVSRMTIYRWIRSDEIGFPKPIYIGRNRYWKESAIVEFLNAQEA